MDDLSQVMLTPHSPARLDIVVDLGIPIVARAGWVALTPAAIARDAGCTRQAVHQWCGAQAKLRTAFAARFTGRWERWAEMRVHLYGPAGLLPCTDTVAVWSRVWLSILDVASRDREIAELVSFYRRHEAEALSRHLQNEAARRGVGLSVLPATTAPLHALVEGLRTQLTLAATTESDESVHQMRGLTEDLVRDATEAISRDLLPALA